MIIGIDASRAFLKERTGIEEYSFQVIKNLINELKNDQVVLYVRSDANIANREDIILPASWKVKKIKWPFFWTQLGLSLEMLMRPVDVLFIPSHVVPFIHPQNTFVTIHGLEYEFFPEGYSFWERLYMRLSIQASSRWAKKIIAVSQNTKKDLINLYKVPEEKIEVVYEGVSDNFQFLISNFQSISNDKISKSYLLFIGRLEARKNIVGIIKTFEILKEKYKIPHQLILAGKPGYGYDVIRGETSNKKDIVELGFVSEEKKINLLRGADVFLFPSFYEGFGLPILEAQALGVPVVTSNISSMPEISTCPNRYANRCGRANYESDTNIRIESCLLVDPRIPEQIAEATYKLISDKALRDDIIKKGCDNVQRFSWDKCSTSIATLLHG